MDSLPRLRRNVYLIGDVDSQIVGNKLPTKLQVFKVLFFNTRILKKTMKESIDLVIKEVRIFWDKASIPTQKLCRCKEKLNALYQEYRKVQNNAGLNYNLKREDDFSFGITMLFDIAHGNVLEMIDENKKQFLIDQRSVERKSYIAGFSPQTASNETADESPRVDGLSTAFEKSPGHCSYDLTTQLSEELENLSPEDRFYLSSQELSSGEYNIPKNRASCSHHSPERAACEKKNLRGNINVMTPRVGAVFDKYQISYRAAVHIIAAVAGALGHDLENLTINKSSNNRIRNEIRKESAENVKTLFGEKDVNAAIVHWDGKLIPDSITCKRIDRLPVLVTSGEIEKLLNVPALEDGRGKTQANAIYQALYDWGLTKSIKALCCDTTNSNLGGKNGAAVLLEQLLNVDLLYLPCRHHIYELTLAAVFDSQLPGTNGPNVPLFKRFRTAWSNLDKTRYKNGLTDNKINERLQSQAGEIDILIQNLLTTILPRDDYKELLQLSRIFIGLLSPNEIKFHKPGAYHHARWMAKAIYSLKIYLFRDVFLLTDEEEEGLLEVNLYVVFVYLKSWFSAPLAIKAPNNDLKFVRKLHEYKSINPKVAEAALKKIQNHLYYLGPEASVLSFFDDEGSIDVKRRMLSSLKNEANEDDSSPKKYHIHKQEEMEILMERDIDYFITSQSIRFFERFGINTEFLQHDISEWLENDHYLKGLQIVSQLKVVNDVAESAIKLTQDFIKVLTNDEAQKQYLLQVVSEYQNIYPNANKRTLTKKMRLQ